MSRAGVRGTRRKSRTGDKSTTKVAGESTLSESQLDRNLVSLGAMPERRRTERTLKALRVAKDYREKFPRATDHPEVDASVQRTLDLVHGSGK